MSCLCCRHSEIDPHFSSLNTDTFYELDSMIIRTSKRGHELFIIMNIYDLIQFSPSRNFSHSFASLSSLYRHDNEGNIIFRVRKQLLPLSHPHNFCVQASLPQPLLLNK